MSNWIIQRQEEKTLSPEAAMLFDSVLETEDDSNDEDCGQLLTHYSERRRRKRGIGTDLNDQTRFRRQEPDGLPVTIGEEPNQHALESNLSAIMDKIKSKKLPGSLNDLRKNMAKNSAQLPTSESPSTPADDPKADKTASVVTTTKRQQPSFRDSGYTPFSPIQEYDQSISSPEAISNHTLSNAGTFRSFFGAIANFRRKKRKRGCTVKISTGYEVTVSKARMYHLKKKWSGLDVMLPKNHKGVLERYEQNYTSMRNISTINVADAQKSKTSRANNYLKKGEGVGVCAQKPPFRPQSAPLFRHVWNQDGEPRLHTDMIYETAAKNQRNRKRPVSTAETAASRSRRLAVQRDIQKKEELKKQKSSGSLRKYFKLKKHNSSTRHRKNRRIRPATAEPTGAYHTASPTQNGFIRPNTAMGMLRSNRVNHAQSDQSLNQTTMSTERTLTDISAIEQEDGGFSHRVPSRMSERSIAGDLNGSLTFQHPFSTVAPDSLPDYEIANGTVSLSHHLFPASPHHLRTSSITEQAAENVAAQSSRSSTRQLDDLERELESYMSASYDVPITATDLLQTLDGRTSKRDQRLLERAQRELQQEKETEARRMGKALSRQIKKSALERSKP
mmetsp:Transcript_3350/g.12727  ORF Transcript_3350/g.12727 Transcript_3350/m.12727 type:complete len:617 (-) Transcript_3350:20-1870(-)|eukprot:CAMPEP_0117446374 /NCGR_PEP_ID=MMETSP0759-20121206/6306_1 /TAXON_ID=63605 /ORGANISM="Percolomonas cosmopolitus, Strain WS" /LENGTH=616 /DNA_ID=CAMNT_0005238635 /DNA_START=409 /DNA_END=2259 /DNA_ORIENTATION=+